MAEYEIKNGVGIIPEGTTEIVDRGFKECKELVEVTIPQGVTRIGKYAFCECTNLKKVVIPDSVKIIDDLCFDSCTSLRSIAIPKSAEKVSIFFTYNCNDLESIVVEEGNPVYDSRDNCNALIMVDEKKKSVLLRGCKNTVIPNTVKMIEAYAFVRVNGLVSVTIPDSVSEIRHCNFMECPDLKEIVIPYSVKKIGEGCFCDCPSLNRLTILGPISKLYAWEGSPNIEELTFGEGIKSVSKDFKDIDCPKLKVINVPKGTADYYKGLLPAKYHSLIKEADIAPKSKKQGK